MKRIIFLIILSISAVFTGCTYIETAKPLSEFDILFDVEELVIKVGESAEIPFTVTGTDGMALDFTPSVENTKVSVKIAKMDYTNAQGVIKVTAPENSAKNIETQVFLTISDSHGRKLSRFVDLTVEGNGIDDPGTGTGTGGGNGGGTSTEYGDLGIFFDMEAPSIEPGTTLEIPFTVTGSEGVTLSIVPSVDNEDFECRLGKVDYVNYVGTIKLTSPDIVTNEMEVKVSLSASDTHGRNVVKSVKVKVIASPVPEIEALGNPTSMAVKAGGSFTLSYKVHDLAPAAIAGTPAVETSAGWSTEVSVREDVISVKFIAPTPVTDKLTFKISAADDHGRKFEYSGSIDIVEFSTTAGAANCHIVKPGSTLTIKAVKGNSTVALDFDNAVLVWQDAQSLVSSVSGNGSEGVVVVKLSAGKQGNAVVAARKGNTVVWSWHVWVSDYDPEANIFEWKDANGISYKYMDRNLGAMSAEKYSKYALGLMYQWGRKDPFPGGDDVESSIPVTIYDINNNKVYIKTQERPTYNDRETTNLQLAIENPDTFYWAPSSSWPAVDWLTNQAGLQNNDLWGGKTNAKTIYDPCPEGWWVPAAGDGWGFRSQYKKAGKLNDDSQYDESYPWYQDYDKSIGFRYKTTDGKEFWFPLTGNIDCSKGTLQSVGGSALYNTRSDNSNTVLYESMAWGNPASETGLNRPYGASTRCIKE
ncbi:MAG: hypothetical protein MJY83_05325 [Bacteroidales bacterium]|nr:hypothetical protein [Bacteroidales bacterium]